MNRCGFFPIQIHNISHIQNEVTYKNFIKIAQYLDISILSHAVQWIGLFTDPKPYPISMLEQLCSITLRSMQNMAITSWGVITLLAFVICLKLHL